MAAGQPPPRTHSHGHNHASSHARDEREEPPTRNKTRARRSCSATRMSPRGVTRDAHHRIVEEGAAHVCAAPTTPSHIITMQGLRHAASTHTRPSGDPNVLGIRKRPRGHRPATFPTQRAAPRAATCKGRRARHNSRSGPLQAVFPGRVPPAGHTTQHVFAPARPAGRKAGQQGEQAHVRQQLGSGWTDGVRIPVQRHGCRHAAHTSHATKRTVGGGVRACLHASSVPAGAPGAAPSTHNPHPPVPGSGGTDGMQTPVRRHRCRHATHTGHATSRTVGESACMSTRPHSTLRRGTRS